MIPVKICGLTRRQDAQLAIQLGAAAIGLIFYPPSPRSLTPEDARRMTGGLDREVARVGVFVHEKPERINTIVAEVGLDMVQLSGHESPEDCGRIAVPVIKTFHVGPDFDPSITHSYDVHALLLDTDRKGSYGGTGQTFDWNAISRPALTKPFILSGGLTPENILDGIAALSPQAVDVNSGVESAPGVKDPAKLDRLFKALAAMPEYEEHIFAVNA